MKIFSSEEPIILCDNKDIESSLQLAGIEAFDIHSEDIVNVINNKSSAVMVISNPKLDRKLLKGNISKLNVLIIPCYAFSSNTTEVVYTVIKMLEVDFEESVSKLKHLKSRYKAGEIISIKNECIDIRASITEFRIMGLCNEGVISLGSDEPLAAFTEIGLVPNVTNGNFKDIGYSVNGTMLCDGVCVAKDRECKDHVHELHQSAWSLFQTLRLTNEFPIKLKISENKVVGALTKSGRNIISMISDLMCEPFNTTLLEFAIATNSSVNETVDWSMNSVINESSEGVHVGLGDGIHCPHIDLITPYSGVLDYISFNRDTKTRLS